MEMDFLGEVGLFLFKELQGLSWHLTISCLVVVKVPLNALIRETSDTGRPISAVDVHSEVARAYTSVARKIVAKVSKKTNS